MKDKTKMFICMGIFLVLGTLETMFEWDLLLGWMVLFVLGFGWYSRGAIDKEKEEEREGKK